MTTINVAYFVSPHGFGHATRAAAVMEALTTQHPDSYYHIYSTVPTWLFQESLGRNFEINNLLVDIGLAQKTSLEEDLIETIRRLNELIPFQPSLVESLAEDLTRKNCQLVICDIAPLGIAVAKAANIPSLLIENFTWNWIYEGYLPTLDQENVHQLSAHIDYLKQCFNDAQFHIQASPICTPIPEANLQTTPISRQHRETPDDIRRQLNISQDAKMVLITMGGIPWEYNFLDRLEHHSKIHFLIPGGSDQFEKKNNLVLLPHHSGFLHPDLIRSADAVIGKAGYSTVAEVYRAGVPFGYIDRPQFRESNHLVSFIKKEIKGVHITENQLADGRWDTALTELLELPRIQRKGPAGADQVADFVIDVILHTG